MIICLKKEKRKMKVDNYETKLIQCYFAVRMMLNFQTYQNYTTLRKS